MIGFIDSGVGGLNVLACCVKKFNDDFVFLCDNLNSPYGNKRRNQLLKITKSNIDFLIKKYNVEGIVIACNTLSATIGEDLKKLYNIPIILTNFNENKLNLLKKEILFFGTKNTIKNNKIISKKITNNAEYKALSIYNLPKYIDLNINNLDNLNNILKNKLNKNKYKNIKTIVLCCTHYKSIKNQIIKSLGREVDFYEYEDEVADEVKKTFDKNKKDRNIKIEMTDFYYPTYITLKSYLVKMIRKNN